MDVTQVPYKNLFSKPKKLDWISQLRKDVTAEFGKIDGAGWGLTGQQIEVLLSMVRDRLAEVQVAKRDKLLLSVELPIELTNGNDGRGSRWFRSSVVRKKVEKKLIELRQKRTPFDCQVRVHVTRIMGKGQRAWDTSSLGRGNWKEIEDALVVLGWFHDDSPRYIAETRFFQSPHRREKPAILVEVFEH